MKQLFQIIALNLFGVNALQIILAIASAVLVLQMLSQKISGNRRKWKIRKQRREMENDMWAIE